MIDKHKTQELAEYLNLTQTRVIKQFKIINSSPSHVLWVKNTNLDWDKSNINQSNKLQVENWFKTNKNYIWELSENYSFPAKKKLTQLVVSFCKKNKITTLLDFGGGIGEDAIAASKAGVKTTLADLPGVTLDFAKWRIKKHNANVKILEITKSKPLKSNYQIIICFEVFQHLFNPIFTAKHLWEHLDLKGYLFTTFRFKNPTYHMALKKNYYLEKTFPTELNKIGFKLKEKVYLWGKGSKTKYLYIYQK